MSEPNPEALHGADEDLNTAFQGIPYNIALLTTLLRCYDLLTVIAHNTNPGATNEVIALHRNGDFWNDPPIWNPVSWSETPGDADE